MTGVHCSCCSGAHNYPMEVAVDTATWQTVISAFSTPMLWFLSPHTHSRGPHFMLCSLPPRTAPHGASTSRRCTPYKRWVSLPKLDSRAVPYHAGLCTDFHFVPLKLARWQLGWSARAAPCLQGPWGSAWMWLWGHCSTDCSSYKRRYHPAFCHLHRDDICQLHFKQLFCLTYFTLVKDPPWPPVPCAPACTGPTLPTLGANPKAPFHVSFWITKISSAWPVQDNFETVTPWFMRNVVNTWEKCF